MNVPTAIYYETIIYDQPSVKTEENLLFPISKNLSETVISIPMHPYLKDAELEYICSAVKNSTDE